MTEAEWLAGEQRPLAMFDGVAGRSSPRKLQLVSAAACRLVTGLGEAPILQQGVEVLEKYAEGLASEEEFTQARAHVDDFPTHPLGPIVSLAMNSSPPAATRLVLIGVPRLAGLERRSERTRRNHREHMKRCLCGVLRELFGNPLRRSTPVPAWQGGGVIQPDGRTVMFTDAVKGLADAVHVTGDFGRLPILADALEEAGVTDEALIAHCRDGGPHLRGCWALDVVRGRA